MSFNVAVNRARAWLANLIYPKACSFVDRPGESFANCWCMGTGPNGTHLPCPSRRNKRRNDS